MNLDFSRMPRPPGKRPRWRVRPEMVLHLLLGILLLWMSVTLALDRSPVERQHLMRIWSLCGAAIMAVVTPHLLFPQPDFRRHLLVAPTRGVIFAEQFSRGFVLLALSLLPCIVVAVAGGALLAALSAALLLTGVWLLAVSRYIRLGASSQGWQEGTRGGWYRRSHEYMSVPPAIPNGAMPMMLATSGLFATAIVAVLSWAALRSVGGGATLLPALAVLIAGAVDVGRLGRRADAEVFHTQAFFDELLRMYGGVRTSEREALSYRTIYWAPRKYRPAIWATLVQMDRRVPLGRLVAAGHLFLWILMWNQGYGPAVVGYLLMFALAKNMAPALIAGPDASPPAFDRLVQSIPAWIWTRAFASLRWTLPWALSLGVISIFASSFPIHDVLVWTAIDAALAVGAAALITLLTEQRHRRALA